MEKIAAPTVDAFGRRWQLSVHAPCRPPFWRASDAPFRFDAVDEYGVLHGWQHSTVKLAAAEVIERVEMSMGVRCADCGRRFRLLGTDTEHSGCMPF